MPVKAGPARAGSGASHPATQQPGQAAPTGRFAGRSMLGLVAVGAGGLIFGLLLVLVRVQWSPLDQLDHSIAASLNRSVAGHGPLVAVLNFITALGGYSIQFWLLGIAAVILVVRRRYRLVGYLAVAGVGAVVLDQSLKLAVGRLRPVVADPIAVGGGFSFPSGHALSSLVSYGALLLIFMPVLSARARRPVIAAVVALVVAIGCTRLALGVHYLSDVIGGWCLGAAWLAVTAYAFEVWRQEAGRRSTDLLSEGLEPESADELKPTEPHRRERHPVRIAAALFIAWLFAFGLLVGLGLLLGPHNDHDVLGDLSIPRYLAEHRTDRLTWWSMIGGKVGNTHLITYVGVTACALAVAVVRRWRPVLFLVLALLGELTLFLAVSGIVGRDRPDAMQLDQNLPTSSFPSGHIAAALCLYTAIAILVLPRTTRWWRWLTVAAAVLVPAFVAWSRMYRSMHHPTDVLGSVLLAACWLTALVLILRPNADRERRSRTCGGTVALYGEQVHRSNDQEVR